MKSCLIVVDYQKDFVTGSLGFPAAEAIDEAIAEKIARFHEEGGDVIFTLDTHGENYLQTQEGRKLPIAHCIKDSDGWQLYGKTAQARHPQDILMEKPTFPSLELAQLLREKQYDEVELCGVVTDICVISNAVMAKAALPEAELTVDSRCTAALDPQMKEKALDVMESLQVRVINH